MIYSWVAICIVTLAVAYSMAEICSALPVAGGQYSWVAVLAPPSIARGSSWVTGWMMITGWCFYILSNRRLMLNELCQAFLQWELRTISFARTSSWDR